MKAINISILLNDFINQEVFELQKQLINTDTSVFPGYLFFKIPHITLCHCHVADDEVIDIANNLRDLVDRFSHIEIVNLCIEQGNLNHIKNKKTSEFMRLYNEIVEICKPYSGRKGKKHFFGGDDICRTTIDRVDNFSKENYNPHITLGPGTILNEYNVKSFQAHTIAVSRLGRYCTIDKVLDTFKLL